MRWGEEGPLWYRLDGRTVVPCYRHSDYVPRDREASTVGREVVQTAGGPFLVSTVFLGVDHDMTGHGPPLVFESMAFEGEEVTADEVFMERYVTWEEAEEGHAKMVQLVKDIYGEPEGEGA